MRRLTLILVGVFLFILGWVVGQALFSGAAAYTITGPDQDGRHATVRNVISYWPAVERALPASLEVHVTSWHFNYSAKTSRQPDGHIRIDISGALWNPMFSGLLAHELGHVLELTYPGLPLAWEQELTRRGFGPSTWRSWPQSGWWWYSPSEAFAENFRRGLYWWWYSDLPKPRTYLAWLSRVEMWTFLGSQGVR